MIRLRDYQQRGVRELRDAFRAGFRAPLYVGPTGMGKTVVIAYIAHGAASKGKRLFIVVHRQELLMQTSRALDGMGIPHGLIAPGFTPSREPVQVCMVQTLVRRIEKGQVGHVDIVFIDEAHHAVAGSWLSVIKALPGARLLGVTATPERLDGQGLGVNAGGVFDTMVMGPTIGELIDDGYLCRPLVYAPPSMVDMTGARIVGGDYSKKEIARRVDKPMITGDAVAHYKRICPGVPAIAFCASIEHAKNVAAEFRAAGFRATCIDGKMRDDERRDAIEGLASGKYQVLTSCEIVSEGTDIPVVTAAILLRPTQSLGLFMQQCGRVLRPVYPKGADLSTREARLAAIAGSEKPHAIILDHVGNVGTRVNGEWIPKHGLPDQERDWSLDGRPKRGRGAANDNEPQVKMQQCPKCYAAHAPAAVCPACGHVYENSMAAPRAVDGELQEITEADKEKLKAQRKAKLRQARTLDDLKAVCREIGYSEKYAEIYYQKREEARAKYRAKYQPRRAAGGRW